MNSILSKKLSLAFTIIIVLFAITITFGITSFIDKQEKNIKELENENNNLK